MGTRLSATDAAELAAFRARKRRNAARKAKRIRGEGYVSQQHRMSAYAPLYADSGVVSLADLDYVAKIHQQVLNEAVVRLVQDHHYSWSQVGRELGVSRQAAQQRFGHLVKTTRRSGGQPAGLR